MANDIATVDILNNFLNGTNNAQLDLIETDIWNRESYRAVSTKAEVLNMITADFSSNEFSVPDFTRSAVSNDLYISYQNNRLSVNKFIDIKHDEIEKKNINAAIKPVGSIVETLIKTEKDLIISQNDSNNKLSITSEENANKLIIVGIGNEAQKKASEISTVTSSKNFGKSKSTSTSDAKQKEEFFGGTFNKTTNTLHES